MSQQALADAVGVSSRAVGMWENDKAVPRSRMGAIEAIFRAPLEPAGDPVELAVKSSELTADRQHVVIGFYLRQLREQRAEAAS